MSRRPPGVDGVVALAESAVVLLSGVAAYRLLEGGDAGVIGLIVVSVTVAALWVLVLSPWNRWGVRRLTRGVAMAGLSVLTSLALVMTGLFWWAAALIVGAIVLVLSPVLRRSPGPLRPQD